MRKIETTVYLFDELSKEAQKRAIENERQNPYYLPVSWFDCVYDQHVELFEENGIDNAEFSFTGFCSQGDGASVIAGSVDLEKLIKVCKLGNRYQLALNAVKHGEITATIERVSGAGNYAHEHTIYIELELAYNAPNYDTVSNQCDQLQSLITDHVRGLCRALYRDLESEYDYMISDDVIADYLAANEYEFTETGDRA